LIFKIKLLMALQLL